MKITKQELKKIIMEEIEATVEEGLHEESLDEDGSEEVQEMFDYSGTRDGPKSEKYYSDKRKKEKTGPRHEKDYADDRKNKKTRPSNAPQKYQRHYEE